MNKGLKPFCCFQQHLVLSSAGSLMNKGLKRLPVTQTQVLNCSAGSLMNKGLKRCSPNYKTPFAVQPAP